MFWFFERQRFRLYYEVRRQTDGDNYELVITHPDGHQDVEHFVDSLELLARMQRLQHSLRADGWQPPAARSSVPHAIPGRANA